jgi:hypothetical protein
LHFSFPSKKSSRTSANPYFYQNYQPTLMLLANAFFKRMHYESFETYLGAKIFTWYVCLQKRWLGLEGRILISLLGDNTC